MSLTALTQSVLDCTDNHFNRDNSLNDNENNMADNDINKQDDSLLFNSCCRPIKWQIFLNHNWINLFRKCQQICSFSTNIIDFLLLFIFYPYTLLKNKCWFTEISVKRLPLYLVFALNPFLFITSALSTFNPLTRFTQILCRC